MRSLLARIGSVPNMAEDSGGSLVGLCWHATSRYEAVMGHDRGSVPAASRVNAGSQRYVVKSGRPCCGFSSPSFCLAVSRLTRFASTLHSCASHPSSNLSPSPLHG